MDDDRIRQLTEEVLAAVGTPSGAGEASLEERVAALERAVNDPTGTAAVAAVAIAHGHASLRVLNVAGGGSGSCLLEPDKPCERSGMCRVLGH